MKRIIFQVGEGNLFQDKNVLEVPRKGDMVLIFKKRYLVVSRTFDYDNDEVIIELSVSK